MYKKPKKKAICEMDKFNVEGSKGEKLKLESLGEGFKVTPNAFRAWGRERTFLTFALSCCNCYKPY